MRGQDEKVHRPPELRLDCSTMHGQDEKVHHPPELRLDINTVYQVKCVAKMKNPLNKSKTWNAEGMCLEIKFTNR